MIRVLRLAAAGALLLATSSCAAPSIEEIGRAAIRERSAEGKAWFTRFVEATDTSDKGLMASKLEGLRDPYAYGWDAEGDFYTLHYYREHVTTSGGWWGKQRTVSACVRFERDLGSVTGTSVACLAGPPYSDYTDEWVVVAWAGRADTSMAGSM
ncbi:hypothetical protein [Pseudarthrobacter sp. LT1]|uniref:hypothetical protein n=1 Tax=Pseudarthrobacter sp. LT1 TaxID=3111450 RepID=UPI002D768E00|nr:hypothetical protein [Pseudarthrobacter sp. LT1]WRT12473.1 hypothetical protein VIK36_14000 [Pseudarthrobacter sp. LT1]